MNQRGPTEGGQDHCCASVIYNLYKFGLGIGNTGTVTLVTSWSKKIMRLKCYWQGIGVGRLTLSLVIYMVAMN